MRDTVLSFSNNERVADTYRGVKAMEVDNVDNDEKNQEDTEQHWEERLAKATQLIEELSYMGKSGGKKAKGRATPRARARRAKAKEMRIGCAIGARRSAT